MPDQRLIVTCPWFMDVCIIKDVHGWLLLANFNRRTVANDVHRD